MSGGEKTEQPTAKKIRDAREQGQVAKSQDIPSTALLIAMCFYFYVAWDWMVQRCRELIVLPATFHGQPFWEAFKQVIDAMVYEMIVLTVPALAIVMVVGVMANVLQTGPMFAFKMLQPDLNKLNPVEGAKRIFSMKSLVEFIKSSLKVLILSYVIYYVIRDLFGPLLRLPFAGVEGTLLLLGPIMKNFAIAICTAYVLIALADYFYQQYEHNKSLMMSKEEIKQEFKQAEGDPHVKGQRKQLAREMIMHDTAEKTRKSSVVVTNPTHYAIALFYDKDQSKLPLVLAKGEGFLAKRMIEIAQEEGIPIMQNVPLAHALFEHVPVNHYIPSDLIQPVAEVLRWVQQLKANG